MRAEADFGDFEFAVEEGPFEALLDRHGEVVDVATLDLHAAVGQGPHPVVVPGSNGDGQAGHVAEEDYSLRC